MKLMQAGIAASINFIAMPYEFAFVCLTKLLFCL